MRTAPGAGQTSSSSEGRAGGAVGTAGTAGTAGVGDAGGEDPEGPAAADGPGALGAPGERDLLWALPVGVVGLLWFAWGAGTHPLHGDEYATWHAASLDPAGLGRLIQHKDVVQAPYYALMHAWIGVFGDSELSLRLPSVLALAGAAYLVTVLGFRLADRTSGYAAGTLLLLVPSMTDLAQYARGYALAVLLAVASTLAFLSARRVRGERRGQVWRWVVYGVLLVLLAASHLLAVTVVAAHAITLVGRGVPRPVRLSFMAVIGAVTVVLFPAAWWAHTQVDRMLGWNVVTASSLRGYAYQLVHSLPLATIMAVFAGMGVLVLARRADRRPLVLLLAWSLLPPLILLLLSWSTPLFYYRYLQFTAPAIVLLAGIGLVGGVAELVGPRASRALPVTIILLVATTWMAWGDQQWARNADRSDRPDLAGAAETVLERSGPGEAIVFADRGVDTRTPFDYAARDSGRRPRDVLVDRTGAESGWFGATECSRPVDCLGSPARVWLLSSPAADDPLSTLDPGLREHLATNYRVAEQWDLTGAQVVELVPTSSVDTEG
jgi:mannosyltransferase